MSGDAPYRDGPAEAPRDEVARFAGHMRRELRDNAFKRPWKTLDHGEHDEELAHHVRKLRRAFRAGNAELVQEYAADVANCAMFVSHATGALDAQDHNNHRDMYGQYGVTCAVNLDRDWGRKRRARKRRARIVAWCALLVAALAAVLMLGAALHRR